MYVFFFIVSFKNTKRSYGCLFIRQIIISTVLSHQGAQWALNNNLESCVINECKKV